MSLDGWVGDVTYVTVACKGPKRFFDLDAVRVPYIQQDRIGKTEHNGRGDSYGDGVASSWSNKPNFTREDRGGAPPLDWHLDNPTYIPPPRTDGDPMPLEYRVGDVFDRLAEIGDGSIDLIVTSPPFLALRSYLPADHPDKHKEIGSEPTPAAFIDTLLQLTAEFGRVLAPHGSLCVELGDTFSGAGGYGSPDSPNPAYGAERFDERWTGRTTKRFKRKDDGWPLAKSLTGIPTLYPWSLAYGRNLLTGEPSPAGCWRIRNIIVWARPNPPVGALGDKFRPATSYITIACRGTRRFFDLDAVRTAYKNPERLGQPISHTVTEVDYADGVKSAWSNQIGMVVEDRGGAPPLDWHTDNHPEDGDWLWKLPTQPYKGSHYATFPLELPTRLIKAMCPRVVCQECGNLVTSGQWDGYALFDGDCRHDAYRTGTVLDPFAGSGTTLEAAQNVGRHAIGIDLDETNAHLAQQRVGMFMEVDA